MLVGDNPAHQLWSATIEIADITDTFVQELVLMSCSEGYQLFFNFMNFYLVVPFLLLHSSSPWATASFWKMSANT